MHTRNFVFSSVLAIVFAFGATLVTSSKALSFVAFGTYVGNVNQVQNDRNGGTTQYEFNPYIGFNYRGQIAGQWYALPEFGIVVGKNTDDIQRRILALLWHVGYGPVFNNIYLRTGIGTFVHRSSGTGKQMHLPAGATGQKYYAPGGQKISWSTTFDGGVEYIIDNHYSIRGDLFIFQILKPERRNVSYALSFSLYL